MAAPDVEHLSPDTQAALAAVLDDAKKQGLSVRITSAFRSRAQQQSLFDARQQGLNPYPVARPGTSAHEGGMAVDLVNDGPGGQEALAKIAARHGLSWKGNFDRVHFDYTGPTVSTFGGGLGFKGAQAAAAFVSRKQDPDVAAMDARHDPDIAAMNKKYAKPATPAPASTALVDPDVAAMNKRYDPDVAAMNKKFSQPARKPSPNVKIGPHGRVIDPTTGQEFGRAGNPAENAQMSLGQKALEVAPEASAALRDAAFKALSFPFDPATAYVNELSAQAIQGERDPHLGPYLGPLVAAGRAAVTTAPKAAVKGLFSPQPVKPEFFTPPGYDLPGRPGGIDLPISKKANRYLREGANLAASVFAVDPAASALYSPLLTGAGKVALATADKTGLLDRKIPVVGQTARRLTEDAALRQATNRAFVHGDAETARLLREGEGHVRDAESLYQGLAKSGVKLAQKIKGGQRVNVLDELVGHWIEAGQEGATYATRDEVLKESEKLSNDPAVQQRIKDAIEHIGNSYSRLWQETGHSLERLGYLHLGTTAGMGGQYLARLYHSASRNPSDITAWLKAADEVGASPEGRALAEHLAAKEPGGGSYSPAQKRTLTTAGQREAHGAERQASVLFAHGGGAQARLVGRGTALTAIAENPSLATTTQEAGRVLLQGRQYGPLAGRWVPAAVKQVVDRNVSRLPSSAWQKAAERFAGTVKGLWTTANGPVMTFNYLNNRMLAEGEAAISKAGHFTEKDVLSGGQQLVSWRKTGQASPAVSGLLEHSRALSPGADLLGETAQSLRRSVGIDTVGQKIFGGVKAVLGAPRKALEFQRQAMKVGLMDRLLKAGYAPDEAAQRVERALIDYKNTSELTAALDRYGAMPYARHIGEGAKQVGRILVKHPDIPLRYSGLRLGQAIAGAEGGDVQQQWQPGQIPVPSFLPGSRDALGRPTMVSGNLLTLNPLSKGEHGLQGLASGGVYAPMIDIVRNQNMLTGQPIVPPGTPPEDARRLQMQYLAQGYAPPLTPGIGRSWQRVFAATQGVPLTSGRTTEAQTVPESLSQALLGVRITHAEDISAKGERMAPTIDRRADEGGRFVDQVDDALTKGQGDFPERDNYRQQTAGWNPIQVRKSLGDIQGLLHKKLMDPTLYDRNGKLTEGGKGQLRRLVIFLNVVADRADALP